MTSYLVLLRGVNVGKNNRLPMADFRTMLEAASYKNVETYIQSGNAVFTAEGSDASRVQSAIETALANSMGRPVSVLVRSKAEVATLIRENPFPDAVVDGSKLFVTILDGTLDEAFIRNSAATDWSPDRLAFTAHAAYATCPNGLSKSTLWKFDWSKLADGAVTTRNWNSLTKLHAMMPD